MNLTENAIKVLNKRYLKRDEKGNVIEEPIDMFERVARAVAEADRPYAPLNRHDQVICPVEATYHKFLDVMTNLEFLPNSPTLMNAGRELGMLSGCFVLPVGDSMEEIFDAVKHAALVHKSGGGTGFSFSRLRPSRDVVKSTNGVSSGPLSFMNVFNVATETIKQGGTRRGANMGMLRVDHPNIIDFIKCKEDKTKLTNFNISVAVTDAFMEAVKLDNDYDIINPRNKKKANQYSARNVFNQIIDHSWKNGEPGVIFIDKMNKFNPTPHIGKIEAVNPCGEQPLLPYESCNLGSINLAKMITEVDKQVRFTVDWNKLRKTVHTAVHFLDNVIDINKYPLPEVEKMTKANRKIGLGVMGWADMLIQLGIPYNSREALMLADNIMATITSEGIETSAKLAEQRGAYPNCITTKRGMRNATITTIAPTGTLSIIAGCSSGIEPLFALAFKRKQADQEMTDINPTFENEVNKSNIIRFEDGHPMNDDIMKVVKETGSCADAPGLPQDIKNIFVTAHDITYDWHIKMQAAFQKHTHNGISKTINFPHDATREDIRKAYLLAYDLGCKGVTVYRDGSRDEQVLSTGKIESPSKLPPIYGRVEILTDGKILLNNKPRDNNAVRAELNLPPVFTPGKPIKAEDLKDIVVTSSETKPRNRPTVTKGSTHKINTGCGSLYVTVNSDDKGVCEVFSVKGKSGGCAASQSEAVSRLISLALRSGVKIDEVVKQIKSIRCPSPAWGGEGGQILSCPDAIAKILEKHIGGTKQDEKKKIFEDSEFVFTKNLQTGKTSEPVKWKVTYAEPSVEKMISVPDGSICPDCPECGGQLQFKEGCVSCDCGYSKCG